MILSIGKVPYPSFPDYLFYATKPRQGLKKIECTRLLAFDASFAIVGGGKTIINLFLSF